MLLVKSAQVADLHSLAPQLTPIATERRSERHKCLTLRGIPWVTYIVLNIYNAYTICISWAGGREAA